MFSEETDPENVPPAAITTQPPPVAAMNSKDADILRSEWKSISCQYRVNGMWMFLELFKQHPTYVSYFRRLMNKSSRELRNCVTLFAHAASVAKSIGSLVDLSDKPDELALKCRQVGGEHAARKVAGSQLTKLFPIIIQQLITANAGRVHVEIWEKFFERAAIFIGEGGKRPALLQIGPKEDALKELFSSWLPPESNGRIERRELIMILKNLSHKSSADKVEKAVNENVCDDDPEKVDFEGFLQVFALKLM